MATQEEPFVDLPASLVEELLERTGVVSGQLLEDFTALRGRRQSLRQDLIDEGLLVTDSSLDYPPIPTTCAVDGSYAIERLLATDLAAAAAVAVEGLTPPSEKRHWERPHHTSIIQAEPHNAETATVLRAVMLGNELVLAAKAPHDLVMLDQTMTLPVIYLNQGLAKAHEVSELACSQEMKARAIEFLSAYLDILRALRSDHSFVAVPKYSTRREVGAKLGWPAGHDDRSLLTLLLQPGELTTPLPLEQPRQPWHIGTAALAPKEREQARALVDQIVTALNGVRVFYYKPAAAIPALRLEVAENIADNRHRLSSVVHGLKLQCVAPGMLEPYPLYLADRTVKALARALPAFRQVSTQSIAEGYPGDVSEIYFAMHGYRTDAGGRDV